MLDAEYFWDDILLFIEEGQVIPILGPELLVVESGDGLASLYDVFARRLAESLRVDPSLLPDDFGLGQVVYAYLQTPGSRREMLYRRMKSISGDLAGRPPEPLMKLASISGFNFFVSTTFDTCLEEALEKARLGGREGAAGSLAYTLGDANDLPGDLADLSGPMVYHLFGRVTSQPDYALTEEDTLEFLHSLQSEIKRPHRLFDELRNHHLLLIGNSYPDWLARFFIRTVRNERLNVPGDREAIVASDLAMGDSDLVVFLSSPLSYSTQVWGEGGAVDFVNELSRRWREAHPETDEKTEAAAPVRDLPDDAGEAPDMESGAVFISYASQDAEAARNLRDELEEFGLDVWLDLRRLEPGDDYDIQIRRNIRHCALFMPMISETTEQRLEGYFRREWRYAIDRAMNIDERTPFILPLVIDDTQPYKAHVPEEFQRYQWTVARDGRPDEAFLGRSVKLVREYRKRERGMA